MVILGVDPGLRFTGFGFITAEGERLKLIKAGVIKTTSKQKIQERLQKIHLALDQLIEEFKPDAIVVEKIYSHYRHPITAYHLGQARGVVCLLCEEKNVPLVEYLPTRVKKAVSGRGHASKYQMQKMVKMLLRVNNLEDKFDITDALSLAIAHSFIMRAKV